MKIQKIEIIEHEQVNEFYDISTTTGNFVIADSNIVVHNSHICTLLITALLKAIPEIFHYGVLKKAVMPLWGVKKWKGKFLPLYTEEEMLKFKQENPKVEITRYKGLGEMDPDQLAVCLLDPEYRRLEDISDCDVEEAKKIFKLMTDAETKRGLLTETEEE